MELVAVGKTGVTKIIVAAVVGLISCSCSSTVFQISDIGDSLRGDWHTSGQRY